MLLFIFAQVFFSLYHIFIDTFLVSESLQSQTEQNRAGTSLAHFSAMPESRDRCDFGFWHTNPLSSSALQDADHWTQGLHSTISAKAELESPSIQYFWINCLTWLQKNFTAKLKPYLQHGIGVRILPWGEADPGWWWNAPLENTQLGFFGTKTYGLPCLRFINLLPQFGVWKWSRTDSFWGKEEGACKGL